MIFALVAVISALTISASAECARNCSNLSVPSSRCLRAYTDVVELIDGRIESNQASFIGNTDCDRDTVESLLNIFCSGDCLRSFVNYRRCVEDPLLRENAVNISLSFLCTRHTDGSFCPVKVLDTANGDPVLPACARGGQCNSTCQQTYRSLSTRLGCCGRSWFGQSSSNMPFFDSCNVTLDGPCEPASPTAGPVSGAGVLYLSMLLVAAASLLSTIIV